MILKKKNNESDIYDNESDIIVNIYIYLYFHRNLTYHHVRICFFF